MHLFRRAAYMGATAMVALSGSATHAHPQVLPDSSFARSIQPYTVKLAEPGAATCQDLDRLRGPLWRRTSLYTPIPSARQAENSPSL